MSRTNAPVSATFLKVSFSASPSGCGTNGDAEHRRVALSSERRKSQRDRVLGPPHPGRFQIKLGIAQSWIRIASRVDLDFLTPRTRRMLLCPSLLFLIARASGSALPACATLLVWAY